MSANPYAPTPEQQAANDQAIRDAIALINRPLTRQEQREADRLTARAVGLLNYQRKLERGHP
jgi:hypothetical protein